MIKDVRLEFLDCSGDVLSGLFDLIASKICEESPLDKFELSQPQRGLTQVNPLAVKNLTEKIVPSIRDLILSGLSASSDQVISALTQLLLQVSSNGPCLESLTVADFSDMH